MKVKSLSRVQFLATPWTAAYQAPPSMGFSRQESWSGLPLPSPIVTLSIPEYGFPVVQLVKNLPAVWETQVPSLGWEALLEKEMATHSRTLAWKIPWTEEPGRLQSLGSQRVRHD